MKFKKLFEQRTLKKPYTLADVYQEYKILAKKIKWELTENGIEAISSFQINPYNDFISIKEINRDLYYLGEVEKIIKNTETEQLIKTKFGFTIRCKKQKDNSYLIIIK